jgi:hypothetical protein
MPWRHTEGVKVHIQSLLNLAYPSCCNPGKRTTSTQWTGDLVSPTTSLDTLEQRKISCPYQGLNPKSSGPQPSLLYQLHWPSSSQTGKTTEALHLVRKQTKSCRYQKFVEIFMKMGFCIYLWNCSLVINTVRLKIYSNLYHCIVKASLCDSVTNRTYKPRNLETNTICRITISNV